MSRCLHCNELVGIAQCPGRCCLHLYFGNVGLRLLPHELRQWAGAVAELCAHHTGRVPDPEARCLSLAGPEPSVVFVFSLTELHYRPDSCPDALRKGVVRWRPGVFQHPSSRSASSNRLVSRSWR